MAPRPVGAARAGAPDSRRRLSKKGDNRSAALRSCRLIYKFKSKAGADVLMLGPQGERVLRLLGREPARQGLLALAELGPAMLALEAAVADDEAEFARLQAEAEAAGQEAPHREGVSLRQRVWPLLELMRHSQRAAVDIVWGV